VTDTTPDSEPLAETPAEPVSERSLLRSSIGLLLIGAAIMSALVAGSIYLTERTYSFADEIAAERGIRRSGIDLLTALLDAETGFRGYLVSEDPAFLDSYSESLARIPALRAELLQRLDEHRGSAEGAAALAEAVEEKMGFTIGGVALARAGDFAAARASVATGEGREAMDRVRAILGEAITEADLRIGAAFDAQRAANRRLLFAVIATALALLGLVAGAVHVVRTRVRELTAARRDLLALSRTLEERVEQRTHDLIEANQEVQRFAYIVTHDLRAPLVNIMGFTSELDAAVRPLQAYVLADGDAVDEQDIHEARRAAAEDLPEAVAFIRASAKKMDGLINAILKISRDGRRELRPERIDIEEAATRATDAVRHQINESGGTVAIDVAAPPVLSDRLSLDQILGNLVDNAIKYAQPGRPLALAIRARPAGRGHVRIEVEDNGRGIAPEDHARVFELFRRAGAQDKTGEGIGLAHVRSLARNLGGDVTVRSTPGQGSTFVLRLPIDLRSFIDGARGR
jgi:signal transduction histidine kinase